MRRIVSLNCEGDRHLERIRPFLESSEADIICLQEVFVTDAEELGRELGYHVSTAPHDMRQRQSGALTTHGIALLSEHTPARGGFFYYHLAGAVLPTFDPADRPHCYEHVSHHAVLWAEFAPVGGPPFRVGTLHHTVTPHGKETQTQTTHTRQLLASLAELPAMVLCGDCNIPRGHNSNYELFRAAGYRDAIPAHYTCSLDPLHRAWEKAPHIQEYMVDYVWLPDDYQATGVHLVPHLSDHQAVVADVGRGSTGAQ